jgi:hypothetical protein
VDDRQRLSGYVAVWWTAIGDLCRLLEELGPDDWSRPTDLPGWDVRPDVGRVVVTGDAELAQRLLDRFAVTP